MEKEVLGLLEIDEVSNGNTRYLLIKDVHLPEQEVTWGTCEPTEGAISKLMIELEEKGIPPEKIKGWWHKHPISNWSGMDDSTFENWHSNRTYVVGLFTDSSNNKLHARVDLNIWGIKTSLDDINVELVIPLEQELLEKCEEELNRKIKETTTTYVRSYPYYQPQTRVVTQQPVRRSNFLQNTSSKWVEVPKEWNALEHNCTCWLDKDINCRTTSCNGCPLYVEMVNAEIYKKKNGKVFWIRED